MQELSAGSLVAVTSLREFFRDAFHAASEHQHLDIDEQSEAYVVNLLTMFSRADALYEQTADGLRIRPLAHMLADALDAPTALARQRALQRLGDVSLFVAGFFARSFARKLVDIDYHIAMGGNAYSSLADTMQRSMSGRTIAGIYADRAQLPALGGCAQRSERNVLPSYRRGCTASVRDLAQDRQPPRTRPPAAARCATGDECRIAAGALGAPRGSERPAVAAGSPL